MNKFPEIQIMEDNTRIIWNSWKTNHPWKVEPVWKIYFPWKTLHPGSFMGVLYQTFKYEIMPLTVSERRKKIIIKKLARSLHRANTTLIWNSEIVKESKTVYQSHIWANCEAPLIFPPYYLHRINHAPLAGCYYSLHILYPQHHITL